MEDIRAEFEKYKNAPETKAEVRDRKRYGPGVYTTKMGYYGKWGLTRDRVKWELSCALITGDWKRVRNALMIIGDSDEPDET